jgi:serine/threonine protein kinase
VNSVRSSRLDSIVTEYLLAIERGESPDEQQVLDQHSDIADELLAFFEADANLRRAGHIGTPPATTPDSTPRELSSVGNYELLEEVARGGMGVVYKARHRELNRIVALKMLLSGNLASPEQIQRFQTEAEAAAGLDHIGIVSIHDVARHNGFDYYTMSFVEGESLADRLERGPLSAEDAAELVSKISRAMAYAHDHRVLHRDLKPANILLDSDNQPRITDFGVAKSLDDGRCLTVTGEIVGTLQFMAPEQAAAERDKIAVPSDVYSLGAILFTALTAQPVFAATSQVELLLQLLEQQPVSPRELVPSVPPELEAICLRCLEKEPARRYQSARDLAVDLECYLAKEPTRVAARNLADHMRRWVRRKPLLAAHVGTLLLVDLLRQTKYLFSGNDDQKFRPEFSLVFLVWILSCFAFQHLLDRPRSRRIAPFLWSAVDVALLSLCLFLADGPIGMLLATLALLIVVAGMFLMVRLVVFITAICLIALLALVSLRPEATPPHYVAVFTAVLLATSVVVSYQVRRLRILGRFYQRFRG